MADRPPRPGEKRPADKRRDEQRQNPTVGDRVEDARARAEAAEADAARASHERLKALLALPPRQAMHRLDDDGLSPADRVRLRDALAARTPRWKQRAGGGRARRTARRLVPRAMSRVARRVTFALTPLALIAVGAFAAAWWRTPFPARILTDVEVSWRYPDGRTVRLAMPAGHPVDVQRSLDPTTTIYAPVKGQDGFAVARVDPRLVGR